MFFFPLILSAALDLTLPEFQPTTDTSGNYIVSSDDGFEALEELPDGLTVEAPQESISDNDKKRIDVSFNDKVIFSDRSEPVRSFSIPEGYEAVYLTVETLSNIRASSQSPFPLQTNSAGSHYVTLTPGNTYYLSSDAANIKFYTSLTIGTNGTVFQGSSSGTETTYTPNVTTYALVADIRTISAYYLVESTPDITGNDYSAVVDGLSVLNQTIIKSTEDIQISISALDISIREYYYAFKALLRAILFVCIWKFILPLAMKIRDHVFRKKHE